MGKKKVRKDYGPYVEKTEEGRVVVTRRGYVAGIVVVALLVFGVVSKVVEIVRPRPAESTQQAYGDLMGSLKDEFGVPRDTVAVTDPFLDSIQTVVEDMMKKETEGVSVVDSSRLEALERLLELVKDSSYRTMNRQVYENSGNGYYGDIQ